jgi:hypothetical protein
MFLIELGLIINLCPQSPLCLEYTQLRYSSVIFCAISATIDVLLVGYLRKLACCSLFLFLLLLLYILDYQLVTR